MAQRYNLINIRTLLKEGFSEAELRDFCFDTPDFRPVYDELAQNTGKAELVRKLLEYAQQKRKLDPLLTWAEKNNPAQFQARQPYFKDDPPASDSAPFTPYISNSPFISTPSRLPDSSSPVPPSESKVSSEQPSNLPTHPPANPSLRIFLCHTAADKPTVRDLYHRLRTDGFEPWLDEEDLLPGQKWQKEIPKAVRAADVVLVCLSRNSITKDGYVQQEIKFALEVAQEQPEEAIFLIPFRLENCLVPEILTDWHWVNFFEPRGYERLIRALRTKAEEKSKGQVEKIETEAKVESQPKSLPLTLHLANLLLSESSPTSYPSSSLPKTLPRHFDFEPEMILIPAGEFLIGSNPKKDKRTRKSEQPQHTLYLPDYYMAKTPVTQAQYAAFVQATGHHIPNMNGAWAKPYNWSGQTPPPGKDNHPVVLVSWDDAITYCRWLAETTGKSYRLPSEAEWEKGARSTDGRIYPWGNEWEAKHCNSREGGKGGTTPVDAYPNGASPYGLLDMAGNVWEWCSTIWQEKTYPFQIQAEWTETYLNRTNVLRALRGESWYYDGYNLPGAVRSWYEPNYRDDDFGFRVVVSSTL